MLSGPLASVSGGVLSVFLDFAFVPHKRTPHRATGNTHSIAGLAAVVVLAGGNPGAVHPGNRLPSAAASIYRRGAWHLQPPLSRWPGR